jgi:hypothetical protein
MRQSTIPILKKNDINLVLGSPWIGANTLGSPDPGVSLIVVMPV